MKSMVGGLEASFLVLRSPWESRSVHWLLSKGWTQTSPALMQLLRCTQGDNFTVILETPGHLRPKCRTEGRSRVAHCLGCHLHALPCHH